MLEGEGEGGGGESERNKEKVDGSAHGPLWPTNSK